MNRQLGGNGDLKKLRVAVAGCGKAGQELHLKSLSGMRDLASVVAVCDLNLELAKGAARSYGVGSAFQSLGELLNAEKPDAVFICTPPDTHEAMAIEAIEAGCHVFCEKPMALDAQSCERMIRAAEKKGVKLTVNHNQRFQPAFLEAQRVLKGGEMGEVIDARITYLLRRASYIDEAHWAIRMRGSIMVDFFPHQVYLAMALMGTMTAVSAEAWKWMGLPWLKYDTFRFTFFGKSFDTTSFVAHGTESWAYLIDIACKRGRIIVDMFNSTVVLDRLKSLKIIDKNIHQANLAGQLVWKSLATGVRPDYKRWSITHKAIARAFLECITNDTDPPVPPQEGMEAVRVTNEAIDVLESKGIRNPD